MGGDREHVLTTVDGVPISAVHRPSSDRPSDDRDLGFVVVHGFTGNWRQERVQRIISRLSFFGGVVALDMRGHGGSGGSTTVGDTEIHDVAAGVRWARELGYERVATVGFSLGGAVVLREAALMVDGPGEVDAAVSVSAPAFWYYKGTRIMRLVHHLVESPAGRLLLRARRTRVSGAGWPEVLPVPPHEAAAALRVPLLVVHGDADHYFPLEHPRAIHAGAQSAGVVTDLWIEPGIGHAEAAMPERVIDEIGAWVREVLGLAASGAAMDERERS